MDSYWTDTNGHATHPVKYESETRFPYCTENGLNFSTSTAYSEDDTEYAPGRRGKTSRQDPLSHRIIEKRRRDRMNSCLADLSRLIPPQYQRKGRGRIEKTEIIEMAIRHLKHLQKQECSSRESACAEQYRIGFQDCVSEAAKFLLNGNLEDICYQLVNHLKKQCSELMKGEFFKHPSNVDSVSASSGSPPAPGFHHSAPLSHLRDILTSDVEQGNSNDHNDVKDLSFRGQPPQTPVITSTGPSGHMESNSHDMDTMHDLHHHDDETAVFGDHHSSSSVRAAAVRMRKFSETSTDIEHNNNSYKFKNYIQQRFSQDNHHHHHLDMDETGSVPNCSMSTSTSTSGEAPDKSPKSDSMQMNGGDGVSGAEKITKKRSSVSQRHDDLMENSSSCDEKPTTNGIVSSEFKGELLPVLTASKSCTGNSHSFSVPIFALHAQGTFYVPLNIEYGSLAPYLGGYDLLDKSFVHVTPLHPININVQFNTNKTANISRPKIEGMINGW